MRQLAIFLWVALGRNSTLPSRSPLFPLIILLAPLNVPSYKIYICIKPRVLYRCIYRLNLAQFNHVHRDSVAFMACSCFPLFLTEYHHFEVASFALFFVVYCSTQYFWAGNRVLGIFLSFGRKIYMPKHRGTYTVGMLILKYEAEGENSINVCALWSKVSHVKLMLQHILRWWRAHWFRAGQADARLDAWREARKQRTPQERQGLGGGGWFLISHPRVVKQLHKSHSQRPRCMRAISAGVLPLAPDLWK